ncbi:MAG: PAS domain S-box protein [Alphaproteobacteria bacterium]|nr:PAS domain S-box protein [Alphaproteobacteria bacterium]
MAKGHRWIEHRGLIGAALAGIVVLVIVSLVVQGKIERAAQEDVGKALTTVLETSHQAMRTWFEEQKADAEIWANTREVRQYVTELLAVPANGEDLSASPAQSGLRAWLEPVQSSKGYRGFFVVGLDNINLASTRDTNLGVQSLLVAQNDFLEQVKSGQAALSVPQPSDVPLRDRTGQLVEGLATMFVAAPIRNEAGAVIAILAFRIDPDTHFTPILQRGRIGESGETYAFDASALLVSESRFAEQLHDIGLIGPDLHTDLKIELRDPGVNLIAGEQADGPLENQPLNRMARSATAGEAGLDVEGYRDYRGVPVVGAWLWDDELNLGITTEIDTAEAFATLNANLAIISFATILVAALLAGLAVVFVVSRTRMAESEAYLSAIVENLVDGIVVIDEQGTVQSFNTAAEEIFGHSASGVVGQNIRMLIPERFRGHHDEALEAYVRTGEAKIIGIGREVVGQRKDGTEFPMDIALGEAWSGTQRMFIGLVRDITERKKVEREIADKERLRTILDESAIGVAIAMASDGRMVFRNRRLNEIMQYPDAPSEMPNARDFYVNPDDYRNVNDALADKGRIID